MSANLSKADWAAGGSALLGLLAAFLPWYSYSQPGATITVSGFRASLLGVLFFVAMAACILVVLVRAGWVSDLLSERLSPVTVTAVAAGVALFTTVVQLLIDHGRSTGVGLVLALLVALALVVAAWLRRTESRPSHQVRGW